MIYFAIEGNPVPKQSTRFDGHGHAHTDPRIAAWQDNISWRAREVMQGRDPIQGPVEMEVVFYLENKRRVDLDNLNKAVCDALNGIIFKDDSQVVKLVLWKRLGEKPGVNIWIDEVPKSGKTP